MAKLKGIFAIGIAGEFGINKKLLEHIPEDLVNFKKETLNKTVIMGSNTWKSLPKKLPDRKTIVLTKKTPTSKNDRIKKSLKEFNLDLKQIQKLLNIEEKLTSYSARHTSFQALRDKNVPVEDISELAGHQDLKTTKHYIKSLPSRILDYVNDLL